MNPAELIAAAIEKLEALPVSIVPWRDVSGFEVYIEGKVVASGGESAALLTDADTIVTLHRTIDAQLAILRAETASYNWPQPHRRNPHVIALARAILGEDT